MRRRDTHTEILRAVHDDDLEDVLRALGLLEDVRAGRTRCGVCREAVNLDNLHAVYPEGGEIKVSCNRPDCVKLLLNRLEGRRYRD